MERIDFISSYCDRWCERCAFTDRCSSYACKIAIEMCGHDTAAGLELAVGSPHPVDGELAQTAGERLLADFDITPPSDAEMAEYTRQDDARKRRIDQVPLTADADVWMMRAFRWLEQHHDRMAAGADPIVREALEVVSWDACFITVKLRRALDGRDCARHQDGLDDHPVQNDWNGSAKVALISIDRSVPAWRLIGDAYGDDGARAIAEELARLRRTALGEFPNAMAFVRPGFDEP